MERLGIEVASGILPRHSLTYATARHRCEQCETPDACREWLKTAPEALNFAPKFCPNGDILFELQFDQPGGPRAPEVQLRKDEAGMGPRVETGGKTQSSNRPGDLTP